MRPGYVVILAGGVLVAGSALAHGRGASVRMPPTPAPVAPGVTSSMTGGIPGTLGGTPNTGGSMAGGIPGTLGGAPFGSGGSTTGAIGTPSTQGTTTTGPNGLLGDSVFGSATTGPAR
jgi:hypothetical protein